MQNKKADQEAQLAQVDIGALLANQRQSRGASVKMVSRMVNLSSEIIENMESNQFSQIGTAVYVRGYLSLYAKFLGLDTSQVLHLYNAQYPSEPIAIRPALAQQQKKAQQQRKRHSKTLSLLVSAGVLGGLLYGYFRLEPVLFTTDNQAELTLDVGESDESAVSLVIDEAQGVQNLADDALQGRPVAGANDLADADLLFSDIELESILAGLPDLDTDQEQTSVNTEDSATITADTTAAEPQVTEATEAATIAAEQDTNSAENIPLEITFNADCWLKITDATGKVLVTNTYSPTRPVSVQGKPPFTLVTARPAYIKAVTFNQQTVKLDDYRISGRRYEIK